MLRLDLYQNQYEPPEWDDLPLMITKTAKAQQDDGDEAKREALRESVDSFIAKVIPTAIRRMDEGNYPPAMCRELLNRLNNHIQIAGELGAVKEENRLIQTLRNVAARMDALVYS